MLFIATGLLLLLAFLPVTAFAAKGGNGHGGNAASTVTASVSATPDPVNAGGNVYVSGCGYEFESVEIHVVHPSGTDVWAAGMWYTGCFDAVVPTHEAGSYSVEVYQGGSGPVTLKASTQLTVQ